MMLQYRTRMMILQQSSALRMSNLIVSNVSRVRIPASVKTSTPKEQKLRTDGVKRREGETIFIQKQDERAAIGLVSKLDCDIV